MSDESPTIVGSLDMTDERDRGILRRSVGGGHHKRWGGIDDTKKGRYVQALDVALRMALESGDHRNIRGCVETLAKLEGQNQADEHLAEKYDRIDTGKGTDAIVPVKYISGVDDTAL
jgi:hypothetical protein